MTDRLKSDGFENAVRPALLGCGVLLEDQT